MVVVKIKFYRQDRESASLSPIDNFLYQYHIVATNIISFLLYRYAVQKQSDTRRKNSFLRIFKQFFLFLQHIL